MNIEKRHIVEVVAYLTYMMFYGTWVASNMMSPQIMGHFKLESITDLTWANNAVSIAKIIGNLMAAYILLKFGPKWGFAIASFMMAISGLGVFSDSYSIYVLSRFTFGLGGAIILVFFNPIVVHYFDETQRPFVGSINLSSSNVGNVIASITVPTLLMMIGDWQIVMGLAMTLSGVFLILWLIVGEDFQVSSGVRDAAEIKEYTLKDGIKDPINWILPAGLSGILFFYISLFSLFPMLNGIAIPAASLTQLVFIGALVGMVIGIIAVKIYPFRVPVIRYSSIIMISCAAVMISTDIAALAYGASFLCGVSFMIGMTALPAIPYDLPNMTSARISVIFGMFWSVAYLLETVMMYLAGIISDAFGSVLYGCIFAILCSISGFVMTFMFDEGSIRCAKSKQDTPNKLVAVES